MYRNTCDTCAEIDREIDPETVSETETRRIVRKWRSEQARKQSSKTPRTVVTLPKLRFLVGGREAKSEESQWLE
jgi:hypothetical protein